ncbi:hypothetical protein JAAARDRAFT_575156 [Jaapia argillacea MUCL 33604]|uniref:Uncharacterized protein n=1 Tax=Jaapia argillacea MUCL 33604 TaxID=933084 RepID=A0A067Q2K2_9AGAM|nr:hypothetical protein JAAARDRAFT_575156 [Jaapia argillacea MUCL 33604]
MELFASLVVPGENQSPNRLQSYLTPHEIDFDARMLFSSLSGARKQVTTGTHLSSEDSQNQPSPSHSFENTALGSGDHSYTRPTRHTLLGITKQSISSRFHSYLPNSSNRVRFNHISDSA